METRLRELLQERKISIAEFARRCGVLPSSLSSKGNFSPSMQSLDLYAKVLGVKIWDLIYDCGIQSFDPEERDDEQEQTCITVYCPRCNQPTQAVLLMNRPEDHLSPQQIRSENNYNESTIDAMGTASDTDTAIEPSKHRLVEIMEGRGINAKTLGDMMGMSKSSISHLLNGTGNLTMKVMDRIIESLEIEPYELFATKQEIEDEIERRKAAQECPCRMDKSIPRFVKTCKCCGYKMRLAITVC